MLNKLQQQLEAIYEIDTRLQVTDFLITDPAVASHYDNGPAGRTCPEKLLLSQTDDTLAVALYLDAGIVTHLEQNDPLADLHDGNIHQFWVALEGISHFLYLCWNAGYEREVSLFELELQAEVDKFVSVLLLLDEQVDSRLLKRILSGLFLESGFHQGLTQQEQRRYRLANRYAYRFCSRLLVNWLEKRSRQWLMNVVRRFYRLTQHYKLRYIRQAFVS
ncbi:MAG: hypothetical protein OEZ39_01755 [Gammaproteobacteria bacterium]|nr:hypothetical protein [Gammaproteobacteria bacterium]MDH5650578.1 hypothetical protein [Gammaproteobacteria bacterium]